MRVRECLHVCVCSCARFLCGRAGGRTYLRACGRAYLCSVPMSILEEWTSFVDELVITPGKFIIMGYINFHLDDTSDCNASRFRASIKSTGLIMHVREPTHRKGHTLDVLLTRENDEQLVGNILVKDVGVSDHLVITLTIDVVRPGCCRKKVSFRKLHDINISDFQEEMNISFSHAPELSDVNHLVQFYNTTIVDLINSHAPLCEKEMRLRPNSA